MNKQQRQRARHKANARTSDDESKEPSRHKDDADNDGPESERSRVVRVWGSLAFSGVVAVFAAATFFATCGQWRVANQSLRLGQRAWMVALESRTFELVADKSIRFHMRWKNSGDGPAMRIVPRFGIGTTTPGSECPIPQIPPSEAHGIAPCGPGEECILSVDLPPLSAAEVHSITTEETRFCIYGVVAYVDVFDDPHETTFCVWYDPRPFPGSQPPSFHWCEQDNELR